MSSERMMSIEECTHNVRLMARRTALLYYYFAKTLVDELGDEEGKRLISQAIWAYGEHCGKLVHDSVKALGLPTTPENFGKVADLPKVGWETSMTKLPTGEERPIATFCPLAAIWQEIGPQAAALGRLYCHVDQAKYHAYNPEYEFQHTKNVLDGDAFCEFLVQRRTSD